MKMYFVIQVKNSREWKDLEFFPPERLASGIDPFKRLEYWYYTVLKEKKKCRLMIKIENVLKEI